MEEHIFKMDAKTIVDLAFDNKLFKDHITRDDFNAFEDLISFMLQSRFESYKKLEDILGKVGKREVESKKFTEQQAIAFARYVWYEKDIKDASKGLNDFMQEFEAMGRKYHSNRSHMPESDK